MSKLLTTLMAGAFALTLSGFAAAQNQPADAAAGGATNTPPAMSEEGSAGKPAATPPAKSAADPAAGGVTASESEKEYLAALKKCEPLTGTDKSKCVDAAKKKHGQL